LHSVEELFPAHGVTDLGTETGLVMTGEIDRYKQYALECLRLAQETRDDAQKAQLLEMAQAWQRLAQAASKREQP
jgi:hypothetical protein